MCQNTQVKCKHKQPLLPAQEGKMVLVEVARGETVESLKKVTSADFEVSPNLREYRTL